MYNWTHLIHWVKSYRLNPTCPDWLLKVRMILDWLQYHLSPDLWLQSDQEATRKIVVMVTLWQMTHSVVVSPPSFHLAFVCFAFSYIERGGGAMQVICAYCRSGCPWNFLLLCLLPGKLLELTQDINLNIYIFFIPLS